MKIVFALLAKDWKAFWGDKVAVLLTFLVPFFIIYLMGNIFGISPSKENFGMGGPAGIRLGVVDQTEPKIVQAMIDAIDEDEAFRTIQTRTTNTGEEIPLTESEVRAGIEGNQYRYALVFPVDAFGNGFGFKVKLLQNPRNQIETQTTEGLIQKNLMMAYFENIWDLPILKADPEVVEAFVGPIADLVEELFDVPEEKFRSVFKEDSFVPDFRKIMADNTEGEGCVFVISQLDPILLDPSCKFINCFGGVDFDDDWDRVYKESDC